MAKIQVKTRRFFDFWQVKTIKRQGLPLYFFLGR